jgi:hypothetical protein
MIPAAMSPGLFAELVVAYSRVFSASQTSGVRTIEHNAKVGGVTRSAHLYGLASDMVYDGAPPGPEADTWLHARQLKRIKEGDHDHLMPLEWPP